MDDSTSKYSALVQDALSYKMDSPIYRPTYYKIKTDAVPYYSTMKKNQKFLWTRFAVLAGIFFVTVSVLLCFFVFEIRPLWGRGDDEVVSLGREVPVLFIAGYPKSGMSLMRQLLNKYPDSVCSFDNQTLPEILNRKFKNDKDDDVVKTASFIDEDFKDNVEFDSVTFDYMLTSLSAGSHPASSICAEVPMVMKWAYYLEGVFPKAKYIWLLRDPRAVAYSLAKDNNQLDNATYISNVMRNWTTDTKKSLYKCKQLGLYKCLPLYFEELILKPRRAIPKIELFWGLKNPEDKLGIQKVIDSRKDLFEWRSNDVVANVSANADVALWLTELRYVVGGKTNYFNLWSTALLNPKDLDKK